MKRRWDLFLTALVLSVALTGCGAKSAAAPAENESAAAGITAEMALEGVDRYCRETYDWSTPSGMYVELGEETENEYQVKFRSYTGAFVYFYVDKTSGETRLVEAVPELNVEEDAGTIDLFDYLETKN